MRIFGENLVFKATYDTKQTNKQKTVHLSFASWILAEGREHETDLHGPVLELVFFVLYTAPLSTVIEKHSVLHHSYADDSQIQKSAPPHQIPDLFLSMQK